jgi:hypothetical protein
MADQVFLLVHSAELGDEDIDQIRSSIAAEYEMHKDGPFSTTIQRKQAA